MPKVGGIFAIISGVMEIIGAIPAGWLVRGVVGFGTSGATEIPIVVIAIPLLPIGAVAVVGGISSIHRRNWGRALAGSICAIIFFPLGLPAITLIALSKREFMS